MSVHTPDAGNVGIYGSAVGGVVTTTGTVTGWINENAMMIGLGLSLLSLLIGVVFKILAGVRDERHHRERLDAERMQNAQAHEALRAELLAAINSKIERPMNE